MGKIITTARKSCGGSAPRARGTRTFLRCVHADNPVETRRSRVGQGAGDDSDEEIVEEHEPCNAQQIIGAHGYKYTVTVTPAEGAGLPAAVLSKFNKVVGGTLAFGELPWHVRVAIDGSNPAYELHRFPREGGQDALSVFTKRLIKEDEAVICFAGRVYTAEAWDAKHPDKSSKEHLWCYDLPADGLRGYEGPDLVVAADEERNESCYLQDSWWYGKARYNLYQKVVWTAAPAHPQQIMPYIVYYAAKTLPRGTELDVDWGDECWQALSLIEVLDQATFSWRSFYKLRGLRAHVGGQMPGPSDGAGPGPSTAAEGSKVQFYGFDRRQGYVASSSTAAALEGRGGRGEEEEDEEEGAEDRELKDRSKANGWLPPAQQCYQRIHGDDAMRALFAGYRTSMDFSGLPQQLRSKMDSCLARKTAARPGTAAGGMTAEEEELVASGDTPGCVLVEVRGLHHSVRWASLPDRKAYTVLAKKYFRKGEPIGIYAGDVRLGGPITDGDREGYVFELDRKHLSKVCPGVDWPVEGLVVDAGRHGNVTRYINDMWGQDPGREQNVSTKVVWSRSLRRPFVLVYAVQAIKAGEELLMYYGDGYWRHHSKSLQLAHFAYHQETGKAIKQLEDWVRQHQGEAALREVLEGCKVKLLTKRLYDI